jgi:hypothetical protein
MLATYILGGIGIGIGMYTLQWNPPSLSIGCLLAVGATGVVSFVRHAVFHRSDAARMGWDYGARNNFQIEVGLANLAWGSVAVLAVVLGWGLAVEAALFLVFAVYMLAVVVLNVTSTRAEGRRAIGPLLAAAAFGMMLLVVGIWGMLAA